MKKLLFLVIGAVILLGENGEEIAKRSFEKVSGYESSIAKTTMILKNSLGETNERKMEFQRLERAEGDSSLITFLYPMDIKDTKLLSLEQIGKDDKQWLYLPAIKRVKRISSSNRSGAFMASEFSYEDIAAQNYKNYTYDQEIVKEGEYLVVTRYPINKNSGYSSQKIWVDKESYLTIKGKFYDKQKRLLKTIEFKNYRDYGKVFRVGEIEIVNVQNLKSTRLIWNEEKIYAGLKKRDFSKRALK